MSTLRLSNRGIRGKSTALHLFVGVPVLCAVMALCAWVFWARNGFPPELAPRHWFDLGIAPLLGMVFCGGLVIVLGAGMLWVFGVVATVFGEGVIAAGRQLCHGKARDARPFDTNKDGPTGVSARISLESGCGNPSLDGPAGKKMP
ncbi:hypothetical protein AB7849_18780 [Rhodanobacter sp. 115]|uniref:hypothetical protein n=1 Tax=Rhodanobacter sp. FW021-MT20 TaxID=1162282 RepID=UPI000260FCF9|nr:hypothetical protein [Rhodanobacter sp. 115]EIL89197.1 hypothetical protein UU5_15975 [Rhodanobacter sp. 115]